VKSSSFVFFLLIVLASVTGCDKKEEPLFHESTRVQAPVQDPPKEVIAAQQAFIASVQKVTPSVVNISTVSKKAVRPMFEFSPFFDDFFKGAQPSPRYRRETSLGSGFIINKEGYILTNDHVVRDAESIKVKLSNERVYDGKVVGADPKTDLAVIKISAREDLPVAVLGNSSQLQVGQWAVAIGNPFGLSRTVTVGVISGTGRSGMGIEIYEDFIQTDAAINPGNSGGPLLNIHGEVIGINTAIVASGQGIGFAIPINMAKNIIPQLINKGSVSRSWLGVSIQPVTEELARSFGLRSAQGVLVSEVVAGSPAAKARLRQGDVIVRIDGQAIKDVQQLQRLIAETPIGKKISVDIYRGGREVRVPVVTGDAERVEVPGPAQRESSSSPMLGLTVDELPAQMRDQGAAGVLVTDVEEGSVAAEAGIQGGDVIVAVNQMRVNNVSEYLKNMKIAEGRGSVAFLVKRGGASIYFALRIR
jgi:Do/DeqQ family serine protease